jgi:hypothetical protein
MPVLVSQRKTRVSRKCGKPAVITSSPYKNELQEDITAKKQTEEKKEKKKARKVQNKSKKELKKRMRKNYSRLCKTLFFIL